MSQSAMEGLAKTMRWTDELDRQLLLAILSQIPGHDVFRLVDMEKVARKLGPTCTPRAIEERLKKLKKKANGLIDHKAPHVLGSTRKMEGEFRAKREAETVAVQQRKAKRKATTLPSDPEGDSETLPKKTGARGGVATTGNTRKRKGTSRIIRKGMVKPTEDNGTEEETDEASNIAEELDISETSQADEALNAGMVQSISHKSHHHHQTEKALETGTPEPSTLTHNKHHRATPSVIELDSDSDTESSAPPPVKKRKQEKEGIKDDPPTSTAVRRRQENEGLKDDPPTSTAVRRKGKHSSKPAFHEGED